MEVKCVHGDLHKYPIVPLLLKYKGKMHRLKAAVSPRLSHPLGHELAGVSSAVGAICRDAITTISSM